MNWYIEVIKKYAVFQGRAIRSEFWYFQLFNTLIYCVLVGGVLIAVSLESLIIAQIMYILMIVYGFAILIPSLAVTVRRLHDTGKSGWWYFIILVPFVGIVVLFVFLVHGSQPGSNMYGNNATSNSDNSSNNNQTHSVTAASMLNNRRQVSRLVPENKNLPTIELTETYQTIGRSGDIVINNDYVSAKHLGIKGITGVNGDDCYIWDLGSTNGTYIDGEKLNSNDQVYIDDTKRIILGSEDVVYKLQK